MNASETCRYKAIMMAGCTVWTPYTLHPTPCHHIVKSNLDHSVNTNEQNVILSGQSNTHNEPSAGVCSFMADVTHRVVMLYRVLCTFLRKAFVMRA